MFRRRRSVDDFAKKIRTHLELEADGLGCEGLQDDSAFRQSKIKFGNADWIRERLRCFLSQLWDSLGSLVAAIQSPSISTAAIRLRTTG
jgi:hypothetical protein